MSVWSRISDALAALANGESLSHVFAHLRTPPERRVAFAIGVIALGAKMAKADGQVTRDEVTAFREVFSIPPGEEDNAAKVFNLARQDVAGFDSYARQIRAMFTDAHNQNVLCDVMQGLFHIAMADGEYHPAEDAFLSEVADIFGLDDRRFVQLRAQFVPEAERDPYDVLGVTPDLPLGEIRKVWRDEVRQNHPDTLHARGLPREAIVLAQKRLIAVNEAWERIQAHKMDTVPA